MSRSLSAGRGGRLSREHPRQRELQVERHRRMNRGLRDSSPSAWWKRKCTANVVMTQILTTPLDVMAICSLHHVDLSSLRMPEAITTNNKVSNE